MLVSFNTRRLHLLRPRAGRQRARLGRRPFNTRPRSTLPGRKAANRIQIGDASTVFWADASDVETAHEAESTFARDVRGHRRGHRGRQGRRHPQAHPQRPAARRSSRRNLPRACASTCSASRPMPRGSRSASGSRTISACWRGTTSGSSPTWRSSRRRATSIPALWKYLAETAVLGKRENVPPNLAGEWMRAILTGTPYPLTLLSTVLMRIRADGEVNALRVAILKALLDPKFQQNGKGGSRVARPGEHQQGLSARPAVRRLRAGPDRPRSAATSTRPSRTSSTVRRRRSRERCFRCSIEARPTTCRRSASRGRAAGQSRKDHRRNPRADVAREAIPSRPRCAAEDQALVRLGYYHQRNEFFRKPETAGTEEAAS